MALSNKCGQISDKILNDIVRITVSKTGYTLTLY